MVADIKPNDSFNNSSYPHALTYFQGKMFFAAQEEDNIDVLWSYSKADGLTRISNVSAEIGPTDSKIDEMIVHKDNLYIASQRHIWKYDGVNDPVILNELSSDGSQYLPPIFPQDLFIHRDSVFFSGWDPDNQKASLSFLDIDDNPRELEIGNPSYLKFVSYGSDVCTLDLEISCYDSNYESIFESDLTAQGVRFLRKMIISNGVMYFTAMNRENGIELWKYKSPRPTSNEGDITKSHHLSGSYSIYPNPASRHSNIVVELQSSQELRIDIYDLHGRPIIKVFDGLLSKDREESFQSDLGLASGLYFYRIQGEHFTEVLPFLVTK